MLIWFSASGRSFISSLLAGIGLGSVFALRIFCAIVSALSVRLMRLLSLSSDFDIFLVPSRNDITRVAGPVITGSGCGKNHPSAKTLLRIEARESLLNLWAV